jgi:hypothetical protein
MPGFGVGASLASVGQQEQNQAMSLLGDAATQEAQRNAENTQISAQRKAGYMQLGGTLAALALMIPW